MSDVVVQVEGLWKRYRLGVVGTGTLAHDLNRWWARARGRPDPAVKIGQIQKPRQVVDDRACDDPEYIWALRDVAFEVKRGEVIGIIGRNGAGKSTILKILSRVTAPTRGEIRIRGRIASLLEVGTGFHPELTGRENIFLNGTILGMTKAEIRRKYDEIVAFSEVETFIDTPVKRYSSGMYVRLAFAVAAHLDPEILIVDEVLAVGDAMFQQKCLGKMGEVAKQGRTVFLVSHNMSSIQRLCDQALLMEHGAVTGRGSAVEMTDRYLNLGGQASLVWENPGDAGRVDHGFVRVLIAGPDGAPARCLTTADPIPIVMEFELKRVFKQMVLGVSLMDSSGNLVLSTVPQADGPVVPLAPGRYRAVAVIAPGTLHPKTYTVRMFLGTTKDFHVLDSLKFPVHDCNEPVAASMVIPDAWKGTVNLACNWAISPL